MIDLEGLYRDRYEPTVRWLSRFMKNEADAEEIAAAAFEKLARRTSPAKNPEGLLWTTAYGLAVDRLRHRDLNVELLLEPGALVALEEAEIGKGRYDGTTTIAEAEARVALEQAMGALEADDLEAWALTELRGLTTYEAADVLGVSQPTASRRAERARLTLKEKLA